MPRLREVPRAEASELVVKFYDQLFGDRDPVKEPGTATGTPGNWWTVFGLVPYIFKHATDHFGMFGMFTGREHQSARPQGPRDRHTPHGLRSGQPVRVLAALQGRAQLRAQGRGDRRDPVLERIRCLLTEAASRARMGRRAGPPGRQNSGRHFRSIEEPSV